MLFRSHNLGLGKFGLKDGADAAAAKEQRRLHGQEFGTSVRFVPEKAAETEADEGQDTGQTDENQSGESEAAQTDQTSAAGTGEGETTE